jgi:hypothetical protein
VKDLSREAFEQHSSRDSKTSCSSGEAATPLMTLDLRLGTLSRQSHVRRRRAAVDLGEATRPGGGRLRAPPRVRSAGPVAEVHTTRRRSTTDRDV